MNTSLVQKMEFLEKYCIENDYTLSITFDGEYYESYLSKTDWEWLIYIDQDGETIFRERGRDLSKLLKILLNKIKDE